MRRVAGQVGDRLQAQDAPERAQPHGVLPAPPAHRGLERQRRRRVGDDLGGADRREHVVLVDAAEHGVEPERGDRRQLDRFEPFGGAQRGGVDGVVGRRGGDGAVALVLRQQRRRVAALRLALEHVQEQGLQVGRCESARARRPALGTPASRSIRCRCASTGIIVACSRRADDWIWDSWIADDGERYHLFFLKAPRALGDPDLRHEARADRPRELARPARLGGARGRARPQRHRLRRPRAVDRLGRARRRRRVAAVLHGAQHRGPGRQGPADRAGRVRRPDDVAARGERAAGRARPVPLPDGRRRLERDLARPVRLPRRRRLAHADHRARSHRRAAVRRRAGPCAQRGHADAGSSRRR